MKPTILIEDEVYKKIMHWVNKSRFEVSGLGMVKVEKDGILRVVSAMLLPQENGATHTDIEAEHVNKALFELRESEGELKFWWHSHVQMGVFWSGTDHDTIKKIGEGGWMVATVFNQKNEVKSCYYGAGGQATPWGQEALFLDDLSTRITVIPDARVAEWDAEYEKNVKVKVYTPPVYDYTARGHYDHKAGKWVYPEVDTLGEKDGNKATTATSFDPAVAPPLHKPEGMSKKTFKKWNSEHVKWKVGQLKLPLEVKPMSSALKMVKEEDELDSYGFDQEERETFAAQGWTLNDIDELIDEDFSPTELVRLATAEVGVIDIQRLIKADYTAEEVMDCLDHGLMGEQALLAAKEYLYD